VGFIAGEEAFGTGQNKDEPRRTRSGKAINISILLQQFAGMILKSSSCCNHKDKKSQRVHYDILDAVVESLTEKSKEKSVSCLAADADLYKLPQDERRHCQRQRLPSVFYFNRGINECGNNQSGADVCRYVDVVQGADLEIESENGGDTEKEPHEKESANTWRA